MGRGGGEAGGNRRGREDEGDNGVKKKKIQVGFVQTCTISFNKE